MNIKNLSRILLAVFLGCILKTSIASEPPLLHLPWTFGDAYKCTQGNDGSYSHNIKSTEHALDFAVGTGTKVRASTGGNAYAYNGEKTPWGNYIKIQHGDYYTLYAHLSKFRGKYPRNVKVGEVIALSGNTGTATTGAHLHVALHKGDAATEGIGDTEPSTFYVLLHTPSEYIKGHYRQSSAFNCGGSGHKYRSGTVPERQCAMISSIWGICWTPYVDASCEQGQDWVLYDFEQGTMLRVSEDRYCPSNSDLVSINGPDNTNYGGGSPGPGTATPPDDRAKKKACVNFITTKTRLYDRQTGDEQYEFEPGESIRGKAWYQNIGSCDPSDDPKRIPSLVLLSKGYKEDSHSRWKPVDEDTTKYYHLEAGDDPHDEKYSFNAPVREGVYNAVFCIDRDKPKGNGDGEVKEIHKSDNCSTETVFTVKRGPVSEKPDAKLVWSPNGPIAGMVCTQVWDREEPSDHGWDNNYLCGDADYGIVWSDIGKVDGMRCTATGESADPHGWDDNTNYLCLPEIVEGFDEFSFYWSSAGALDGKTCVQWTEPLEPRGHTWHDNFLCYTAKKPPPPPPPACVKPDLNAGQISGATDYDYVIDNVGADTTVLSPGQTWHPTAVACSNTVDGEEIETRIGYYLSPCDGSSVEYLDDDGVDKDNYDISGCSAERINSGTTAPSTPGQYILTVCADYQKGVTESSEENNCNWLEVEVR